MTLFVLQLNTKSPVSHDWKSLVFEFSKCRVMLLPILIWFWSYWCQKKMGNWGMPCDSNENIHMRFTEEVEIWVTNRVCFASAFGRKINVFMSSSTDFFSCDFCHSLLSIRSRSQDFQLNAFPQSTGDISLVVFIQ